MEATEAIYYSHHRALHSLICSNRGSFSMVRGKVLLELQTGDEAKQIQQQLLLERGEHQNLIQSDSLD